jgi:hypothetical protein
MPGNRGMSYMKKDCCECRALQQGKCVLGYVISPMPKSLCLPGENLYTPTEPCPKPRTYERLNKLLSEAKARNG